MEEEITDNIFYVYVLLDPRKPGQFEYGDFKFEYEPFYVGKGKKSRYTKHFKTKSKKMLKSNPAKNRKIKKIQIESKRDPIVIKVFENISEEESFGSEISLIKKIGRIKFLNGPLTNATDGGEGSSGKIVSQKTKNLIGSKNKGQKRTPEQVEACRIRKLGTKDTEEVKKNKSLGALKRCASSPNHLQDLKLQLKSGLETQSKIRIENAKLLPKNKIISHNEDSTIIEVLSRKVSLKSRNVTLDTCNVIALDNFSLYTNSEKSQVFCVCRNTAEIEISLAEKIMKLPKGFSIGYVNGNKNDLRLSNLYAYLKSRNHLIKEIFRQKSINSEQIYNPFYVKIRDKRMGPFTDLKQVLFVANIHINKRRSSNILAYENAINDIKIKYPNVDTSDLTDKFLQSHANPNEIVDSVIEGDQT